MANNGKKYQQVYSTLLNLILSPSVKVTFGMDFLKAFQVGDFIDMLLETRTVKTVGLEERSMDVKHEI